MEDALYRLTGVVKRYGEREACAVDRLEIRQGEILCVMGPSGAGKSTLLRLLNFLEPPTSGAITFQGLPANDAARLPLEARRQVTMVFQEPLLFNTTVWDNVAFGLRLRGVHRINGRAHAALEEVGLLPLAGAQAATLSGGEARRAALARAFAIEPQVLLLDEPTANLDPYNVDLIERLICRVNQERGATVVLVTHNVFQARRVAHRVALFLEGRAVEVGEVAEVFAAPRDPRTAAFIRGEMVY